MVESSRGEEGSEMGQNEFGPHTTKEMGLSGLLGEKHVEAQVSNVKTVEPLSSLTVYSCRTPPQ